MRLGFPDERILAVLAHPDDEILCAGTLGRAAEDGAAIGLCCLCDGDKGQPSDRIENLASVRRSEMEASAKILGAELFWGGFSDGSLADDYDTRMTLVEILRRFRPTTVITHSQGDYHVDHRAAFALAEAGSWLCTSPGQVTATPPLARSPALWEMDTVGMSGFEPEFFVDISGFEELKSKALACHGSQLRRGTDSSFAPLAELLETQYRTRGSQAGSVSAEAFRTCRAFKRARAW